MSGAFGDSRLIQVVAGADLNTGGGTGTQFKAIAVGGTIAGTNALTVGLLQNKPKSGEDASLAYEGHMKGVAGATITAGNRVKVTTSGYIIAVTSNDWPCGVALATCASGASVEMLADFVALRTTVTSANFT